MLRDDYDSDLISHIWKWCKKKTKTKKNDADAEADGVGAANKLWIYKELRGG